MNLDHFFYPTSIAVVGASSRIGSVGNDVVKNLIHYGYQGKIYPINPHATTLFEIACHTSLESVTAPIELVIIIVPAKHVVDILETAGQKNIRFAVVISAGFKESGENGSILERSVQSICKKYDIVLLGPNCLGFINAEIQLNASFAPLSPTLGNISLLSQSGALCTAILDTVNGTGLGFSKFISTGNKAGLREKDLFAYLAQDEGTEVIAMYIEDLRDADNIIQTGRAVLSRARTKPVIAIKSGITKAGASASASHTGSLGGSSNAYRALFKQSGIVQASTLKEFFNLLYVFSRNQLPEGNNLAIITNAGGPGVLATDACDTSGLVLAKLSSETETFLANILPSSAGVHNPIDVLGDALSDRYQVALNAVENDRNVNMILVILTPQSMTDIESVAEAIVDLKRKSSKPIAVTFIGKTLIESGVKRLHIGNVSVFDTPEEAVFALGSLASVTRWKKKDPSTVPYFTDIETDKVSNIIRNARQTKRASLTETESWNILQAYGFPFLKSAFVKSAAEATEKAADFQNNNIVLKIVSPDISHKSDVGGVTLNVRPENASSAYDELVSRVAKNRPHARIEGTIMVEMAQSGGKELILGAKKEPGLGTLLMFGMGGVYTEVFKDVAFRFAPATSDDIDELIREIKTYPILAGIRGEKGIDIKTLEEYIGRLSQLVTDFPEIEELDINPFLAFPVASDFRVLDARITLTK